MNFFSVVIAGVLAITAIDVAAQRTEPPAELTFKDVVRLGLQNNLALTQQRNQLQYTQVNKTSTLLQLGPSISANLDVYRNDGNSFNQNVGEVVNGVIDYVGGGVGASIPVFTGFGMINQHRAANNANEAQLHQVVRSQQDVIRDVANQYLLCLLDHALIVVNEENVRTQLATYNQVAEQAKVGAIAEADAFNQEYQVKNAELLLLRARNTYKNDKAKLGVTIGVDPATFEIAQVDWDINQQLQDSTGLDQMYSVAADRRSDLQQATYAEQSFRFGYAAMRGRWFPNIYAGLNYNSRYNYVQGATNRTFNDQFYKDNTQLSYGFSVQIPIWNGLLTRSQATAAKVLYKNASIRRKNTEVVVKADVLAAHQNFVDAQASYTTAEAQLRAAELSYKAEKEKYDLGSSNIVQLSTVNQTYVKAQGDFETARFNLMFQKLLIDYATGTLQLENIP